MKTMMRLLALVLAMVMVMALVACGNGSEPKTTDPKETTGSNETTAPNETTGKPGDDKPVDDGKKDYVITVKDSEGNPVVGVYVNVCKEGASCFAPVKTNENGSATTRLEEASDYYGSVTSDPESKAYFQDKYEIIIVWDPPVAE